MVVVLVAGGFTGQADSRASPAYHPDGWPTAGAHQQPKAAPQQGEWNIDSRLQNNGSTLDKNWNMPTRILNPSVNFPTFYGDQKSVQNSVQNYGCYKILPKLCPKYVQNRDVSKHCTHDPLRCLHVTLRSDVRRTAYVHPPVPAGLNLRARVPSIRPYTYVAHRLVSSASAAVSHVIPRHVRWIPLRGPYLRVLARTGRREGVGTPVFCHLSDGQGICKSAKSNQDTPSTATSTSIAPTARSILSA